MVIINRKKYSEVFQESSCNTKDEQIKQETFYYSFNIYKNYLQIEEFFTVSSTSYFFNNLEISHQDY